MNAVIYARFSSSAQREASIDQQIRVCQSYAEQQGYNIVQIYSDRAMTGRTANRPQFLQMIKDASQGRFCAVLVYALDRFSRDKYDSARYKHELRQHGVRVVSATEPISDNASGVLIESVFEGLAQYYSAELAQKIRRGYEDNARKCLVAGSLPYGYRRGADGRYEIVPEEADIIREVFTRVDKGDSYADIARDLNARGLKTRHGTDWNRSSFKTILRNQRYIGTYISKYNIQEDGVPKIVDKELFYRVQKDPRGRSGPRRSPNGYYSLTGKLYCGLCGDKMTGVSGTSQNGNPFFYYTCHSHRAHNCPQRSFARDKLEAAIYNAIKEDVLSDDAIRWMAHETILDREKVAPEIDVDLARAQLAQVKTQKKNVMNAIRAGIFTNSTRDELLDLEEQEAALEERIREAETAADNLPTEDDIISYLELFREGCGTKDLTVSAVLDAFVTRAEIHEDYMLIYFKIKKEDRQKTADLPSPDELCSSSCLRWTCGNTKRTLYHQSGFFILKIAA